MLTAQRIEVMRAHMIAENYFVLIKGEQYFPLSFYFKKCVMFNQNFHYIKKKKKMHKTFDERQYLFHNLFQLLRCQVVFSITSTVLNLITNIISKF
jgi:hypothetical protein